MERVTSVLSVLPALTHCDRGRTLPVAMSNSMAMLWSAFAQFESEAAFDYLQKKCVDVLELGRFP